MEDQGRRGEVSGSCGPVEGAKWDAARQAECARQRVEGEPRDREVPGCCRPSAAGAVGLDDFGPVEDWGVEYERGDQSRMSRVVGELESDSGTHRPAEDHDLFGSSSDGVSDGFVNVSHLGAAEG